ncbi:hypothetical protein K8I85_07500 [bacterium]|nr:hypothetical protein [bacterium]
MGSSCDLPMHGFTVVVETPGRMLYIGRYHSETEEWVLLNDVDAREHEDDAAKTEYLEKAVRYGVFKNMPSVKVPRAEVASVKKLVDYAPES